MRVSAHARQRAAICTSACSHIRCYCSRYTAAAASRAAGIGIGLAACSAAASRQGWLHSGCCSHARGCSTCNSCCSSNCSSLPAAAFPAPLRPVAALHGAPRAVAACLADVRLPAAPPPAHPSCNAVRHARCSAPCSPRLPAQQQPGSKHTRTRGQRLLELLSLNSFGHAQRVQVAAAADLELGRVAALLDLHGPRILPPGDEEELLDLLNLLRLRAGGPRREGAAGGGGA